MESGEIVGIGDYHVETKREKRWSLLSQLLADPILGDEALCDSPSSNSMAPPWMWRL
ncbi:BnaC02g25810D [Brassica napus]|uniref:BnaC02g25810D protein n=1 Tax=Brassica napus TaxID=3708 RepID=A0A078GB23_BRANA|nr:BnaC02g25810D [Brassica napus]